MNSLITILQIFGLIVLVLVALGFAARMTLRARAARQANKAARIGVEAPANPDDSGAGDGR
jgi:hypothetical protein